ncbi:hypothetical protein CCHR01_09032 [Colletotrichum chrysophilum]|uniref:Uncharacterized protein n=1 Tax=Colletotrichum chrysophilum TaxID=1836956 RepID=A0AAD9AHQ3_9PEZI|nr:hypothetical protein CCHR01_09032 [Colletotrichum chrysophilum]
MEEAHQVIFETGTAETLISDDTLLIKISGPSTRALQLVDLPGLIMYHSEDDATIKRIRELVENNTTQQAKEPWELSPSPIQ